MTIKMPSAKLVSVDRRAAEFISRAGTDQPSAAVDETTKRTVVNMRLDPALLRRIDAAAKKQGVTRTAWLSMAAAEKLGE
jgi:predicted DNA binding CopG/RHH family protein